MQKKIYSLFIVSCSLALFFLASCDSGGGNKHEGTSSSSVGETAPNTCTVNCSNPSVVFEDAEVKIDGAWNLTVWGQVNLDGDANDTRYIKSILIEMYNKDIGGKKTIMDKQGLNVKSYDLKSGQSGFPFKDCNLSKYNQQVYITVSVGGCEDPNDATCEPKQETLEPFKKPHQDCQTFELTTSVSPSGAGSVSANPPGPYERNQRVTLTATANSGYAFFNWSADGTFKSTDSYEAIIDGLGNNITAVFVEGRNLGSKTTIDVKAGEMIKFGGVNIATYNADGSIRGNGNFKLTDQFQSRNHQLNMAQNKNGLSDTDIPSPSKTVDFTPAVGSESAEIEMPSEMYVVARTGANWNEWYLLWARTRRDGNRCVMGDMPPCAEVTIWKAQ